MTSGVLKVGAILALLMASAAGAYADNPTAVLEQERGYVLRYPGPLPEFSDSGPCYLGMHSQPFPNLPRVSVCP
jgi:hypothetical protein